jgi:thiamine-monophosphate kinase
VIRTRRASTIAELGEFGFLSHWLARLPAGRGTVVGPGQDCAVVRSGTRNVLLTVDVVVENVHFRRRWATPRQVGRKSLLVNASDIAAMGGRPRFCVASIGVPPRYAVRDLSQLEAGIVEAARACGITVVGGNLTRSAAVFVSITLLGDAPHRLVTRRGARPGDRLYVTGALGDAALAVRCLRRLRPAALPRGVLRRLLEPTPRLQAGRLLVESGIASAMIDVSDGLLQDLGHLCRASGVGAVVRAPAIPVSLAHRRLCGANRQLALMGGEDYELLCAVPEGHVQRLDQRRRQLECPITCIGEITRTRGVRVVDARGTSLEIGARGYDHFRAS